MSGLPKAFPDQQKDCSACGGQGTVTCHVCHGRKYSEVITSWFDDDGRYQSEKERDPCTCCHSSGKVSCGQCGGTGNSHVYGGGRPTDEGVTEGDHSIAGLMASVEIDRKKLTDWMVLNNVNPPVGNGDGLLDFIRFAEDYGIGSSNIVREKLNEVFAWLGGNDAAAHGSPNVMLAMLIMAYRDSIEELENARSRIRD